MLIKPPLLKKQLVTFTAIVSSLFGIHADAAGFQLNETSTSLQGTAMAGSAAQVNDVSAMFSNPATLSTLSGLQAYIGASQLFPNMSVSQGDAVHTFNVPGTPPTNFSTSVSGDTHRNNLNKSVFIPNGYIGWHFFNNKFSFGVAVLEPYYMSNNYSRDSVLRFAAVKSEINSVNINPSIAYQVNEQWSLGVGFQAQYLKTELSNFNGIYTATPAIDMYLAATRPSYIEGDNWGYGYTLGALYQPNQLTRLGIGYRSQISSRQMGSAELYTLPGEGLIPAPANTFLANVESYANTNLKTPGVLTMSAARDINAWTVKATAQVSFWNGMNRFRIETPNGFNQISTGPMKWRDAWFGALGVDYRVNPSWVARGGVAYDETPVSKRFNDPRFPDADRVVLNFGLSYMINKYLSLDGAYSHIFMNDQRLHATQVAFGGAGVQEVNQVSAKYKGSGDVVALAVRYTA
ncbi:outer membrane protein transport protein [Legionella lytica]|uniref:Outer membrane protein transport protein n=1 Tax=Legionella lytica TaxID=96232 RepID=A0ABY4Y7D5_9GAMM|nr:outer membrane protein transport protein [Legionella lytica]USQ13019.1 outer membrane protein transport protein [Legionella lytica]